MVWVSCWIKAGGWQANRVFLIRAAFGLGTTGIRIDAERLRNAGIGQALQVFSYLEPNACKSWLMG